MDLSHRTQILEAQVALAQIQARDWEQGSPDPDWVERAADGKFTKAIESFGGAKRAVRRSVGLELKRLYPHLPAEAVIKLTKAIGPAVVAIAGVVVATKTHNSKALKEAVVVASAKIKGIGRAIAQEEDNKALETYLQLQKVMEGGTEARKMEAAIASQLERCLKKVAQHEQKLAEVEKADKAAKVAYAKLTDISKQMLKRQLELKEAWKAIPEAEQAQVLAEIGKTDWHQELKTAISDQRLWREKLAERPKYEEPPAPKAKRLNATHVAVAFEASLGLVAIKVGLEQGAKQNHKD